MKFVQMNSTTSHIVWESITKCIHEGIRSRLKLNQAKLKFLWTYIKHNEK